MNHKWLINVGILVLGLSLWWGAKLVQPSNIDRSRDVEEKMIAWRATPRDEGLYRDLERALEQMPGQKKALQGEIAQILLVVGRVEEAALLAKEPICRLRSVSPLHAEFAEVSVVIEEGRYQEALERSVNLKEKLSDPRSVLYGRNLLRIACLHAQIGNRAGEQAVWNEWKDLSVSDKIVKGLGNQRISFQAYLEERSIIEPSYPSWD